MAETFIEADYRTSVLTLFTTINAALNAPEHVVPLRDTSGELLVEIAEALLDGFYRPDRWFARKKPDKVPPSIGESMPAAQSVSRCQVLCLTAADEFAKFTSMRKGGIVYEDPFYAILACYNFFRWGTMRILPFANDCAALWRQRKEILEALANSTYDPRRYFLEAEPIGENDNGTPVKLLSVAAQDLAQLRKVGIATALIETREGISKYILYRVSLPKQPKLAE